MGTPLGGERDLTQRLRDVRQRLFSPGQQMDAADSHDAAAPVTPPTAQPPVTLDAIAALLDSKLACVTNGMKDLKVDVEMLQSNLESVAGEVESLTVETRAGLNSLAHRVTSLESMDQRGESGIDRPADNSENVQRKIEELEAHIAKMRTDMPKDDEQGRTMVVGGLAAALNLEDAYQIIATELWQRWAPTSLQHYVKGDFKGIVFMKFKNADECEAAIRTMKDAKLKCGDNEVWAKKEMPLETRTVKNLLFAVKLMMLDWNVYDKRALWVDTDEMVLKVGFETIMTPTVVDGKLAVDFADGWRSEVECEAFKKIYEEAVKKLQSAAVPTKGVGKGKRGKSE